MNQRPKILVVDDLATNRLAIRMALRGIDATIVEASNGFDALSIAIDEEFALILLDVQMPEMDGFEVCERLAVNPQTAETPVIFVTAAHNANEDRLHGYLRGATDYLSKPINDQILRAKTLVFLRLYQQNRALQAALEAAKVADRVKDSFLANVSHELRTPLNAVIGLSALALNSSTEPRQREYLEKVSDAGQTLLAIINDLLDLTKIAAGEMTFEATPFSLRKTAARALSVLGHHAAEKGLPLSVHIDERIPEVLIGDPLRIEQILLNLLNNAIKFTDSGHIVVRITLESCDEQRARLLLEVEDSGIGMSDDEIAHIYQPFVQADPSITRKHGGTGLGLAICRQLAEGMHGSIEVSSRPGEGTVFRVRLTLGCAPAGALPSGEETADGESLPNHYRGAQVLVVDDQALNREIVFDLLGTVGIVPRLAENGQAAIDILTAAGAPAFDLVLMDIQMPVLDGLAATRRIRALPGFATLPIVAMTAHTMVHEKQVYFAEGMNDHLGKPFSLPNFFALLARWLAHRVAPLPTIAAPSCAASDGGDLPNIVGLDSRAAMQRFAGNQARYRHWLGEFVGESASFVATLEALLASGAHEAARQATHAFRGRVGVLGMRELHRQATALEQAIRTGKDCDALRQQLARSIVDMCGQVQAALQPSPRPALRGPALTLSAPRPASPPPASITALLQLLDTADGNSAAAIQRCLDEFPDSPWQPLLLAALTEVQRFDFEAARQCLADHGNGPIQ
jgi:signal transduction histidine kinase/HPt (histidine-containing phosphotransfer) domain-containing protein